MTTSVEIKVTVNGEERTIASEFKLNDWLESLGFDWRAVAVEYNGVILKRATFAETVLADGDRLEIVRFVQGG